MQIYFGIIGILSLVYYSVILIYTRKWNSTFAWFWAMSGVLHLFCAYFIMRCPVVIQRGILILLVLAWTCFLYIEYDIVKAMKQRHVGEIQYLIVLGAQIRGRKITNSLMRRIECAFAYLDTHPQVRVIVSGGQGPGEEISEALAMEEELIRRNIASWRIIKEARSTSTLENLTYSFTYIQDPAIPCALVTNNFHVYRALLLGKRAGYNNLQGIAASSNPVLLGNYMMREFFAILQIKYLRK